MSIKTTKRMALGVIASLVFAPLVAIAPANAASTADTISYKLKPTGNTATADITVAATESTSTTVTRAGATLSVYTVASTDADWAAAAAGTNGRFRLKIGETVGAWVDYVDATTTATITVPSGITTGDLEVEIDLDTTDGGSIVSSADTTLTIVNATAPKSVTWATAAVTEISASAVDYALNITPKDANGASTILLDNETITVDVAPVTGASATQVIVTDASKSEAEAVGAGADLVNYSVNLDGSPAGATGSTVPGTEYTMTAQLVDGTTALGAPAATKYKRLANTAGLTGSLVFTSDAAGTTPITSIATSPTVATASFYALVKDGNGALVKGVTVAFTGGGVNTAAINTAQTGLTTANTATPTVAGTGTVTATIVTGTSSITGTLSVVATAGSTLVADDANWSVVRNNGSGVKVGATNNVWSAAPNTTSFAVTLSGLTANTAVKLTAGGTATTPKVDGVAAATAIYPVANASGSVTVTLTVASGTNTQTVTLAADTGAFGGTDSTLTITFTTAAGAITTVPAASSLNMSTLSASQSISATVADQYGNAITGGSVVLTNTSAPAGVTLATAVNVMTDAAGKATVSAAIGSVAGSYVFTVQAKDANNTNIGSASTITYQATATGIAGSLTLTDGDTDALTLTTDNKATRTVVIAPAALTNALAAGTDNTVAITVTTATPAGLAFTASATNGARLFTTDPKNAVITAGKSSVTGTAGTTTVYAVPTKVGDAVITVTAGGLTQAYTLTGKLAAAPKAQLITLTAGTNADGRAAYTVTTTDTFGNPVAANVDITVTGSGFFSNGFKGITVPTSAAGTNSFEIVSPQGGANTLSATIATASYQAITATEATAQSVTASVQTATATVTVVAAPEPEPVYEKPALSFAKSGGRIVLSGTAVDGEGDIIIYVKSIGSTVWVEKAKTLEVASPGDFNGSIRGFRKDKVIRVKQEGTGLFSNQIIVKASR